MKSPGNPSMTGAEARASSGSWAAFIVGLSLVTIQVAGVAPVSAQHMLSTDAPAAGSEAELLTREIGSISASTAALLMSGQQGGEIAGSLIWTVSPRPSPGGVFEVLIFVDVDGRTLLEEHTHAELDLGFFAYVFSDRGSLMANLAQGLSIDLETYEERLLARGLKFVGRLSLPPGAFFARILVRNQGNGRVHLTQARIDVPGEADTRLLFPPLFEEPRGDWILVGQDDPGTGTVGLELRDVTVLPASRVVVESREPTALYLGGTGWNANARITARVIDAKGRQVAEPVLTVNDQVNPDANVVRFFAATLDAVDLSAGFYSLEVTLDDEITGSRLTRSLPLAVVTGGRLLEIQASRTGPLRSMDSKDDPEMVGLSEGEFASRYFDALYLLSQGDRYGARDAVVEAERVVVGHDTDGRRLAMIAKTERQVIGELVAADPDVLRPLVLLHRDVFRQHVADGETSLADASWPLAAELAEQALADGRSHVDLGFTQTILVSLAADLVRAGAVNSSVGLLGRALKISPDDPDALLALGATFERSGHYQGAIRPLRTLVDAYPDNAEGALRLAVNLARDGKTEQSEARFRALIVDGAPTWITVLAYQELARQLPLHEAEEILKQGVERYPRNQALRVQLAYVVDRRGQSATAAELVEEICSRGSAPATSPRVRYPAWPALGLEQRIAVLQHQSEPLLPALKVALENRSQPQEPGDAT